MAQSRSQSASAGLARRLSVSAVSSASGGGRSASMKSLVVPASGSQSQGRSQRSLTPVSRPLSNGSSRHQSSESTAMARRTPAACHDPHRNVTGCSSKRPPFVVGTGNTTAYRSGAGSEAYKTAKSKPRNLCPANASQGHRTSAGISTSKHSGTEIKVKTDQKPGAQDPEPTMIANDSNCDVPESVQCPGETDSAPIVVADPLPEFAIHRRSRKLHQLSTEQCIKEAVDKLNEFAATQNNLLPAKSGSTISLNDQQQSTTGNDVMRKTEHNEVCRSSCLSQTPLNRKSRKAAAPAGNDVSITFKQNTLKKEEGNRSWSAKLPTACRPLPTRSSLLRQALNSPMPAPDRQNHQQRALRAARSAITHNQRPATELENQLHRSVQQHVFNAGRVHGNHDPLAQLRKQKTNLRTDLASEAQVTETQDKSEGENRCVDTVNYSTSERTVNVDGRSLSTSSLSSPRTYILEVLTATDDDSSREITPRIAYTLARRCRKRRPQSRDQHNRWSASSPSGKHGEPAVRVSPSQSSSAETFVHQKPEVRLHSRAVGKVSTPEVRRPPRRLRSVASSALADGDIDQAASRQLCSLNASTKPNDSNKPHPIPQHGVSRLPRLVGLSQVTLPTTSSVSATTMRAPQPRSFRYSRFHRRAIEALVPNALRDVPCHWVRRSGTHVHRP